MTNDEFYLARPVSAFIEVILMETMDDPDAPSSIQAIRQAIREVKAAHPGLPTSAFALALGLAIGRIEERMRWSVAA